jgi:nucleolar protein 53
MIDVPAVVEPHQGTSYNPPVDAHLELLRKAHEAEERRVAEAERLAETKKKMEAARIDADDEAYGALPSGMRLDTTVDDEAEKEQEEEVEQGVVRKQPKPKSKAQKNKAAKLLAEVRFIL